MAQFWSDDIAVQLFHASKLNNKLGKLRANALAPWMGEMTRASSCLSALLCLLLTSHRSVHHPIAGSQDFDFQRRFPGSSEGL